MLVGRQTWSLVLRLAATVASVAGPAEAQTSQPRVTLPPVIVTAPKESTNIKDVPGSVTAVTSENLTAAGVRIVSDAALFAPNTFFTEFTARKASNPRFRGIGASPGNLAVTTYIDGVPQLNANSSSIELLDVSQIEFVRGPQSPLYGRNALGGIINITIKSGTNQFHGSLFEFLRNDRLNANAWARNWRGDRKAAIRHNVFGGTTRHRRGRSPPGPCQPVSD